MGRVDEHGRVKSRRVVIRETVIGPYGPIGSNKIGDITHDLIEIADLLEDDDAPAPERIGAARNRLRNIIEQTKDTD